MNHSRLTFTTLLIAAGTLLACAGAAKAGQRCDAAPLTPQAIARGLGLAQRTADTLDAEHQRHGTRVVLLARAGQDLTRYGQHFSHVGWAYKTAQGPWRVVHKLNECGTDQSIITRQGLGEFFLDDLWRHEAAWVPPSPELQDALWNLLQDNRRVPALHQRRYSMVSYAWGTRYQQSNQWAIETMALAAEPQVQRREQAQAWLRLKDYRPATLRIGALTRLGGRMTAGNIAFDDHPNAQRFADRIETVTADSVLDWLARLPAAGGAQRVEVAAP